MILIHIGAVLMITISIIVAYLGLVIVSEEEEDE